MTDQFASVNIEANVLRIQVQKANPEGDEFATLIDRCERAYMSMKSSFVLAMDMSIMNNINIFDALQWMAMFFRVLPMTEKLLICTCLCLNEKLDNGVNEFLKLYNPIKPFYAYHDKDEFEAKILKKMSKLPAMSKIQ